MINIVNRIDNKRCLKLTAYRNIPAKIRTDPAVLEHVYKKYKVDSENKAGHSESFIRKMGKCYVPIKDCKQAYPSISLYPFYKKHNKIENLNRKYINSAYQFYTHRVTFSIYNVSKPLNNDNMQVHHLCANTKCCRPSHLALISVADNQREKLTRIVDQATIDFNDNRNEIFNINKLSGIDHNVGNSAMNFDFDSGEYTQVDDLNDWNGEY